MNSCEPDVGPGAGAAGRAPARCRSAAPARTRGRSRSCARGRRRARRGGGPRARGRAPSRPQVQERPARCGASRRRAGRGRAGSSACASASSLHDRRQARCRARTFAPAVEVSRPRGKTTRSSTHWWLGTLTARSVAAARRPRDDAVHPRRVAVDAVARSRARPAAAAVSDAVRFESGADQLGAPDLQVHVGDVVVGDGQARGTGSEIVNVRGSPAARKCQTIRTRFAVRLVVEGVRRVDAAELRAAAAGVAPCRPRRRAIRSIDSPLRSGMSR